MVNCRSYNRLIWRCLTVGCFILIAIGSLMPQQKVMQADLTLTRTGFIEHLLIYGLLGFAVTKGFDWPKAVGLLSLFCLISICFEWIQGTFLNRTFNPDDILANILGSLVGLAMARLLTGLLLRPGKETFKD